MYCLNAVTAVFVIFSVISWINCDICDVCMCSKTDCTAVKNDTIIGQYAGQLNEYVYCIGSEENFNLNSIPWPKHNTITTLTATFNHFKLTYLSNVLCSSLKSTATTILISINLDSNSIEHIINDPFKFCPNLTSISMANNSISHLTPELFESMHSLQHLNISHNTLSELDGSILSSCKQIVELDVSHNQIAILKLNEILDASPNIKSINAAFNALFAISDNNQNKYLQLQHLNLSGNKMTVIMSNTFVSFLSLQYLNISRNDLRNIEPNAFEELKQLQILDLSMNLLTNLKLQLPGNIEHISIAENQLKYWPLKNVPMYLQTLELQENGLSEIGIDKNQHEFSSLKFLNVSRNHLSSLPSALRYPELEVFDGSYNAFINIPPYLGNQAPKLKAVKLRGNPIKTIEFITKISAHSFDLSELSMLTEIDAFAFNSIEPKSDCVELIISHNPVLKSIKNSFERVPKLCRLDLSYNNLQTINHNWVNWSQLNHGVDLQGNPIDCSCNSQWMLDYFVPMLYEHKENQHYLLELRCATPDAFKGHRLVRYVNHTHVFCQPEIAHAKFSQYYLLHEGEEENYGLLWHQGLGLWITIALGIFIIATSLSIVIILIRRKSQTQRKNNRRFNDNGVL